MQESSPRTRNRSRADQRQSYRIKHELPSFIKRGRLDSARVPEQVILELTRFQGDFDKPFDPDFDRYITIPAGNEIHTFDSGRYEGSREGQSFFIPNVIDGRPGPRTPTTLLQATFHVVPTASNSTSACSVELRGYSAPGHARIRVLSDTELTVIT